MSGTDTIHLGFLIFPGFPMACLTSAIEPLRAANEIAGTDTFQWSLISETGGNVTASANVLFRSDLALPDAEGFDMIFLLSGPQGEFKDAKASNGRLRHLARHGAVLGAVSGGIFPLARSGLMQGHECSVHWCYKAAFQDEFPGLTARDDVIVSDGRCQTASGAAAAFDLMLHLIDDALGDAVMTEVACWFQHPLLRDHGVQQRIPAFHSETTNDTLPRAVSKAVEIFAQNLEEPISVNEVADQVGLSRRQLERSFKTATGLGPSRYYRTLRMKAARQLVLYSRNSITSIANSVGYSTSSTLSQHYRECFGLSPQEERRKANLFRVQDNRPIPSF